MVIISDFRNIPEGNYDYCLSALYFNIDFEKVILDCTNNLEKVKKIDNVVKRTIFSKIYFSLKTYIENTYEDGRCISSIFFIDSQNNLFEYILKQNEKQILIDYKVRPILTYIEQSFRISYFKTLFDNFDFFYTFEIDKSNFIIQKYDSVKNKVVSSGKITNIKDDIDRIIRIGEGYKKIIFIYGSKIIPEITKPFILLENTSYGRDELNIIYKREVQRENLALLEIKLKDIHREDKINLFVFGKLKLDIKDAIESYTLKELFIEKKKYDKLKEWIDPNFFNFHVYFIESLENGDVGDRFIKDFNGVMGIKYF